MSTPAPTTPHHGASALNDSSPWGNIRHGVWRVLVLNTLIGVTLWAAGIGSLDNQLVYSHGIGFSIWFIIQSGVLWLHRMGTLRVLEFPRGWRGVLLVVVAICGGWLMGVSLGNWYAGESTVLLLRSSPRLVGSLFLMTACIGVVATYHFYVAGKGADLARQLEVSRRQVAESQLMLLQSQLEPHMLFNTLANLRVLIGSDAQRATQMLDRLNDYLRATLQASRATTHPLAAEFERLNDYLALMSVRMGARLRTQLTLPDDLRELPVPPLLLQPLVENAIKHGLEPCVAGGLIAVSASRQADQLLLEVCDTGVGLAQGSGTHGKGFGLSQVRERLDTAYGSGASLEIDTAPTAQGTRVRVRIPLQRATP